MDDLNRQVLAEKENVEIALINLKDTMSRNEKTGTGVPLPQSKPTSRREHFSTEDRYRSPTPRLRRVKIL